MKRQVAIFFLMFFVQVGILPGFYLEKNVSYDYFRGLPDGSWNGNNGAVISLNGGMPLSSCLDFQLGGSYGLYNWNGRGNLVFANSKALQQIGFVTAGVSSTSCTLKGGIVYDRIFTRHFGVYDLNPSVDQLRFQTGYSFCCDEVGLWGTVGLTSARKSALGFSTKFKAIGQMNLFWSHFFENSAETKLWIGLPYQDSLMFAHGRAGNFIGGFSFRVPLTACLSIDGNGSYMAARSSHGVSESRNYGANMSLGLTYVFGGGSECSKAPYMPVANHSNFFVDTNFNQ